MKSACSVRRRQVSPPSQEPWMKPKLLPPRASPEQRNRMLGSCGLSARLSTEWLDEASIPRFFAWKLRPPSSLRKQRLAAGEADRDRAKPAPHVGERGLILRNGRSFVLAFIFPDVAVNALDRKS